MRKREPILAFGLALLLAPPLASAEAELVEPLGPLDFEMAPAPGDGPIVLVVPVHVGAAGPPDRLVVDSLALAGRARPGLQGARSELAGSGDFRELRVRIPPQAVHEAGTYGIRVRAVRAGEPLQAQALSLSLTRPAAVLHTLPTLRLELVHRAWLRPARLSPATLLLTETSGRAGIEELVALPLGELEGPGDRPLEAGLRIVPALSPLPLGPLKQKAVPLRIEGDLPLGTTTGTLSFVSRQLAAPHTVTVQIVSRVWKGWLLVVLLASLLLGWLVRVWLERRRLALEAGIAARRQVETLLDLAARQGDPELQAKLRAQADELEQEIAAHRRDPDALKAAVARADQVSEEHLRAAEARRADLRTRIAEVRRRLGTPEGQPAELRRLLERFFGELDRQERALSSGVVAGVGAAVDDLEQVVPIGLEEAAGQWKTALEAGLRQASAPPDTLLGAALADLRRELAEFDFREQDLPQLLVRCRRIAHLVRQRILEAGIAEVEEEAERILRTLPPGGDQHQVKTTLEALRARPRTGAETAQLQAALRTVGELQMALEKAQKGAREKSRGAVLAPEDAALEPVLASGPLRSLRREGAAPAEPRTFSLSIAAPPAPVAGRTVSLQLRIHGEAPVRYGVRWSAGGEEVESAALLWRLRPRYPGPLLVRAELRDLDSGGGASTEALLEVRPSRSELPDLERSLDRTEVFQSAAVGLLIAGAGYLVFQNDFVGTFQDFFLAVLWGFTVDAGVSKIREMAAPVLARPVPLPKSEG